MAVTAGEVGPSDGERDAISSSSSSASASALSSIASTSFLPRCRARNLIALERASMYVLYLTFSASRCFDLRSQFACALLAFELRGEYCRSDAIRSASQVEMKWMRNARDEASTSGWCCARAVPSEAASRDA